MRMWIGVEPSEMCRAHLLGEHRELHGLLKPPASWAPEHWRAKLAGHLRLRQIEPSAIVARHAAMVSEMAARGYKHESPLANGQVILFWEHCGAGESVTVDPAQSRRDLAARCPACRARMGAAEAP